MRAAESGKGRAPPEPMKFAVARDHTRVAGAAPSGRPSSRAILLKYLIEPRLDVTVVLLDVVKVDGQRLDGGERREAGRWRHVGAGRVDAGGGDQVLRLRRDHELSEKFGRVWTPRPLDDGGRRRDEERTLA